MGFSSVFTSAFKRRPEFPTAPNLSFQERINEFHAYKKRRFVLRPGVGISRRREIGGFLISGRPGSGKTQLIQQIVRSAQLRGDRVFIVDTKGDMTESVLDDLSHTGLVPPMILAPQDARTHVWMPARDIKLKEDAIELANMIVPHSQHEHPYFATTALQILSVAILDLMARKSGMWTWQDLLDRASVPLETLRALAAQHRPTVSALIPEGAKEQAAGTIGTMTNALATLEILATGWSNEFIGKHRDRLVSINDLLIKSDVPRTVILQRMARFERQIDAWISIFLMTLSRLVTELPEQRDPKTEVPIWFIIDEFAQLPRMDIFKRLLQLGRDRGIRLVLAVQNEQQIDAIYGTNSREELQSSFGTQFIGQMNFGDTAERIAKRFGEVQEFYRTTVPASGGGTRSEEVTRNVPVVTHEDMSTELGYHPKRRSCRFLIVGAPGGNGVFDVPVQNFPKLRPRYDPANWLLSGDLRAANRASESEAEQASMIASVGMGENMAGDGGSMTRAEGFLEHGGTSSDGPRVAVVRDVLERVRVTAAQRALVGGDAAAEGPGLGV